MSLHSTFSRILYWPVVQKIKGEYAAKALKELCESQWKSRDEQMAHQWLSVKRLVNKAAQEVPYYRKSFKSIGWDFNNKDFSYEEFLRLPIVEKKDLRDHLLEFLSPDYSGRVTTGKTSGSTGLSLMLYNDLEQETYSEAGRWRAKDWWGIGPGDPHVSIWGRPFIGYKDRLGQKAKSYLMNTLLFSAFELTEERLAKIWRKICRFKPAIMYGYPSAIFPLAVYLKENGKQADHIGLKVIMTTAETITSQQRNIVEEVFGCKTANEYGCSETGGFVYECPYGSWHISSELTFVEFLDPSGQPQPPGQTGDIVVTHLRNNYMPLIRYKVGDMGAYLEGICSCGRGLPLMKVSVTKQSDIFRLSNGEVYSSEIFDYINIAVMNAYPEAILQFRVVQKTPNRFEIEIVNGSHRSAAGQSLFEKLVRKELGDEIGINFRKVSEIRREPSGKLRYFLSEVT
jgi:phenylacetate-CoA ligase